MERMTTGYWPLILKLETLLWFAGLAFYGYFIAFPEEVMGQPLADDPMAVFGFAALLAGLILARILQGTFVRRIEQMHTSGAIQSDFPSQAAFEAWFGRIATLSFALVVLTLLPLGLIVIYVTESNTVAKPFLMAGSAMGICLVAVRFAHGIASGITAYAISRPSATFSLTPSHPDNCSGFGQLGFYYFEQALILLIPAAFMLFWIVFIGINISQFERAEMAEQVTALIEGRPPGAAEFAHVVETYVVCADGTTDAAACAPDERRFLWGQPFQWLIFYNLIIFLLVWVLPSFFLNRRMRQSREEDIGPVERRLAEELSVSRRALAAEAETSSDTVQAREGIDRMAVKLAELRGTPTFPIPLWTAVTTWISNISAILGLLAIA